MTTASFTMIAFQGALGAFSHQAGKMFYESTHKQSASAEELFIACKTFEDVFERVENGRCRYGVIPLENSSIGSITLNYDLLARGTAYIIAEVLVDVRHQLMALPEANLEEITKVYSHPAALGQCRKFFAHLAQTGSPAVPTEFWDTSGAAQYVSQSQDPNIAAIASEFAAKQYDLEILASNIEDFQGNSTRFGIVIPYPSEGTSPPVVNQAPYKLSCAVELPHKPAALAHLLGPIADQAVNLTKIESRPIPESPWHYRFFLDMQITNPEREPIVLNVLANHTEKYKVLGRYLPWT
jgi:prephenate dehydratase